MAPSTVNVAALHLLKNREAKSKAEFFKLEDTRRMGESGQEVGWCRSGDTWWCNTCWWCSRVVTALVTVLPEVSRAVSTAGTGTLAPGLLPAPAWTPGVVLWPETEPRLVTGVAVPGPSDVAHSTDSNLTFCTLGRCVALRFRFRLRLESHFNFYSVAVHLITLILLGTGYQLGPWAPFVHQIFVRGEEPEPDQAKMLQ